MKSLIVRQAVVSDLSFIHQLITESFAAMNPYLDETMINFQSSMIESLKNGELSEIKFEMEYIKPSPNNFFVLENENNKEVLGCVAIKKHIHYEEAELVRMAVSSSTRGLGLGSILIKSLLDYAASNNFQHIYLQTGKIIDCIYSIINYDVIIYLSESKLNEVLFKAWFHHI